MPNYARLNFTASDYDTILADVIARIQRTFPDWTDFSPANPGMTILELLAYIGSLIRYYQDNQANEAFLVTAWERRNVIRHLRAIGYRLSTASAATVSLTFTVPSTMKGNLVLDQGDVVTTEDQAARFELVDRLEIVEGDTTGTVDAIEGTTQAEDLGTSDGTASQRFVMGVAPFLWGSETVEFDGITWTRADDFLSSPATARHYVVEVDEFSIATVITGDGVNGAIPDKGALCASTYRTGGGIAGNVEANTLKRLAKKYTTSTGASVNVTVTNPLKATGGEDEETIAHAKVYGPKSLTTGGRSIAGSDYEINTEGVSGVARALAQTIDDDDTIPENTVLVSVVPVGAGALSTTLKNEILAVLRDTKKKPNTTRVRVVGASYADVAPTGVGYVARSDQNQAVTILRLIAIAKEWASKMTEWFDAQNLDVETGEFTVGWGKLIPLTVLHGLALEAGLKYANFTSPAADLSFAADLFPRLRAYTVSGSISPLEARITWATVGTILYVREEP